jgi:hypothetical protein
MAFGPVRRALYPRLLGAAWEQVDAGVRSIHLDGEPTVHATGVFRICRGTGRLARFLAAVMRLPAACETAATVLNVTGDAERERWERSFGGHFFITTQYERPGNILGESGGPVELRFRLEVVDGSLIYHHVGTALRLGPLRMPLPRWLAPRITADERPDGSPTRTQVRVEVSALLTGLVISYSGIMVREGCGHDAGAVAAADSGSDRRI